MHRITLLVSPMGHDVVRTAQVMCRFLRTVPGFVPHVVGSVPGAEMSIDAFLADRAALIATDLLVMVCPHDEFSPQSRLVLQDAVAAGKPILFTHGPQPAFRDWPEAEKMMGLLWRAKASHGDFGPCRVRMEDTPHPITAGVAPFDTHEELYCGLENPHNVPLQVLCSGYSRADLRSRHGAYGTGNWEPLLTLGEYGRGKTASFLLGHIWPYYTGHGLQEDSLIAWEPPQVKTLFLRTAEYLLEGRVRLTQNS